MIYAGWFLSVQKMQVVEAAWSFKNTNNFPAVTVFLISASFWQ
jgi:hypothetical protein